MAGINDTFPINGPMDDIMDELIEMEGRCVFRCSDCSEMFERVLDWAEHSMAQHVPMGLLPGVTPVPKQ